MSQQYDNTNRFAAWVKETRPDGTIVCSGEADVDGVKFFVDIFINPDDPNSRRPRVAGKVKRKNVQPGQGGGTGQGRQPEMPLPRQTDARPRRPNGQLAPPWNGEKPAPSYADLDDDIPF
jgi:hypothetical protein